MRSTTPAVSASGTIRLPSTSCSLHCRRKHDADGILKYTATGEDLDVHSLELARHHLVGSHVLSCLCRSSRRSRFGLRHSACAVYLRHGWVRTPLLSRPNAAEHLRR